ncbi:MAG: cysteine desulfurase family protein [Candidatus Paceibacterota bacterium]
MKNKRIYLDYAATTPVDSRVLKKAMPYFSEKYGNPSSIHFIGQEAKKELGQARKNVAKFLNCSPEEIMFTSGGTESENLAIKGIAFSSKKFGKHVIISKIEHLSVSSSAEFLTKHGFELTKISVDKKCNLNLKELESSIKDDTILISVMLVNNEIGTIQPISEISKIIKKKNKERLLKGGSPIYFHIDAEAGTFYLDCNVKKLEIDSLSINGSKMYSLKGCSALFIKKGTPLATQIHGGGQERYLRGGTENIPAIVALGEAVSLAAKERTKNVKYINYLKERLIRKILKEIPSSRLNTPLNSISNIAHFTFLKNKKDLVIGLSKKGIAISRGSACSAKSFSVSATLADMGFSKDEAFSSLRFSLGKYNTVSDIDTAIKNLKSIIKK